MNTVEMSLSKHYKSQIRELNFSIEYIEKKAA